MKKGKRGRKLSRQRNQRRALLKNLTSALFLKEKIRTTEAKAKEMAPFAEKEISRAKIGNLNSRRLLAKKFPKSVVKKLIEEIGPRYKARPGGYTRIIKLRPRESNGARMVIIELVK